MLFFFFFFQAEDGIRDLTVTGVQTCALPILRRTLGLPAITVGFVGTMNRWQGVQGFADVIQRVVAQRGDVGFLFVGDGEQRGPLQAELKRRGVEDAAIFVGRQSHAAIPEVLAAMDIGVLLDSNAYGSPMKRSEGRRVGE